MSNQAKQKTPAAPKAQPSVQPEAAPKGTPPEDMVNPNDTPPAPPQDERVVIEGVGGMKVVESLKPGATWRPGQDALPKEALVGKVWVVQEGYTTVQMDGSFPRISADRIARDLGLDRANCLLVSLKDSVRLEAALKAGLKRVGVENWDAMRRGEPTGLEVDPKAA